MKFLQLTQHGNVVLVSIGHIVTIRSFTSYSVIDLTKGEIEVKETREQIIRMIKLCGGSITTKE